MFPFSGEALKPLVNQTKVNVSTKTSLENQETVISVKKKGHFQCDCALRRTGQV